MLTEILLQTKKLMKNQIKLKKLKEISFKFKKYW